jgi:hypothetical protein
VLGNLAILRSDSGLFEHNGHLRSQIWPRAPFGSENTFDN